MGVRRWLYRQLAVQAWSGRGMSPLNAVIVGLILFNLVQQVLATEPEVYEAAGDVLVLLEWIVVAIFTVEYAARLWVMGEDPRYQGVAGRLRYMVGFFAIVDLVAILPAYLSLGAVNPSGLRTLRLLRVLRFARFGAFSVAVRTLSEVVRSRAYELTVSAVLAVGMLLVSSTLMFLAEGAAQPDKFGSIPRALWWSVVTMTTVGYGDAYPITALGKVCAGLLQLSSIAIIAIPTGILAAAFVESMEKRKGGRRSPLP